jgi:hypothetical protein
VAAIYAPGSISAYLLSGGFLSGLIIFFASQGLTGAGIGYLAWLFGAKIYPPAEELTSRWLSWIIAAVFIIIGMILVLLT